MHLCGFCLDPKYFTGEVVSPATPRISCGLYWGYNVRLAQSFGAVFTESPYKVTYTPMMGCDVHFYFYQCAQV